MLDYVLVAPNVYGTFFFGKITIVLYWLLQIAFLGGSAHRLPLFPLYAHAASRQGAPDSMPTLVLGRAADAEVLLRAIESGAVTQDPAGRHPVAVAGRSRPGDPRRFRARRPRRSRAASSPISRNRGTNVDAAGAHAVRARRRKRSRKRS